MSTVARLKVSTRVSPAPKVSNIVKSNTIDELAKNPSYGISANFKSIPGQDNYALAYGGAGNFFDNPVFDISKQEEEQYYANTMRTANVQRSIYNCPKCGYDVILVMNKQERSGDESSTSRYKCTKCGYEWQSSG